MSDQRRVIGVVHVTEGPNTIVRRDADGSIEAIWAWPDPTDEAEAPTSLGEGWSEVGWLSEDGISFGGTA